ncbi:MAG: Segregation and condensation protein B [Parcubacteria group bacterium GW2011_GWF2_38_76]|nr:MAG: Segregation and condensation protein B [Parcubacteria group bacterium GW2011_GWF2_38_76]HBM46034.1 SMC-Scp complex subunit ScpB [Patescibacteria group bacterium]
MKLDALIEAILYFKGEPVTKKELAKILEISKETLKEAIDTLREKMEGRGISLVETGDEVSLGTAPDASELISQMTKEELSRDLGKAGLETLTVVAYKGPISRSAIDNIRGVNSSFILRNLMIRGLVERVIDPNDQRAFLYKPTIDLLRFLGVSRVDDLPEYVSIAEKLDTPLAEEIAVEDNESALDFPDDGTQVEDK